jgi:hypothetical protein
MERVERAKLKEQLEDLLNEIEAIFGEAKRDPTYVDDPYLEKLLEDEMDQIRYFRTVIDGGSVNLGIIDIFLRTERDGIWDIKRRLLQLQIQGVNTCLIMDPTICGEFHKFIDHVNDANGYADLYSVLEKVKKLFEKELRQIRTLGNGLIEFYLGIGGVKRHAELWHDGPTWPSQDEFNDARNDQAESE